MTNALLVLNAKTGEGILVNSEGSAYARYSAYLPFAGHILLSFSLSHFLLSKLTLGSLHKYGLKVAMISKISEDLRAKVQFVSTKIADQYDALRLTIINRNEGPVDTETFRFVDIIGQKNGYNPHIWDDNGNARWYGFKMTERDYCLIAEIVEDYVSMYADQDMRYHGSGMGGMSL